MKKTLLNYFDGLATVDDVEKMFESVAVRMKAILTDRCITSGRNPADNKRIIEDTMLEFRRDIISYANNACEAEGEQKYRHENAGSVAYYNADYYYSCEAALKATEKAAIQLGAQWGSESIDLLAWSDPEDGMNELYESFNSKWNWCNGLNRSLANIDENLVPPRGFEVRFTRTTQQEDLVQIEWNGHREEKSVLFNERYQQNKFSLSTLFSSFFAKEGADSDVGRFLKGFTVYSYYGYVDAFRTAPWMDRRA